MIEDNRLQDCENGICELAKGLDITEAEIVRIIKEGMESRSPIGNELSKKNKYFIDKMEATFDAY
jgi:hypothetical protein